MSRQQYRTGMNIMSDMLQAIKDAGSEGIIISRISHKANLSHYLVIKRCRMLIDSGLLEAKRDNRNHTLVITEKGTHFFQQMKKFTETVDDLKIRF